MRLTPFRERVRVLYHLSEGYTRILLTRSEGMGFAAGGICWDIPTRAIPAHLRGIGTQFYVVGQHVTPEPGDSIEELRAATRDMQVEEFV